MLDERIQFEDLCVDEDSELTTLYFVAPKDVLEMLGAGDFPEAVSATICLEFPTHHAEVDCTSVRMSPTRENESGLEDYDWYDIELPYNDINELIALAERSYNGFNNWL